MRGFGVKEQAQWRFPGDAPRMERPKKSVFDIQQAGAGFRGDGLATVRSWALPPNCNQIFRLGAPQPDIVSGQRKDATQAALGIEAAIECKKPPG